MSVRICPVMSGPVFAEGEVRGTRLTYCQGSACAWWVRHPAYALTGWCARNPQGGSYLDPASVVEAPSPEAPSMLEALSQLKRGSCWCEMAVGNPMMRDHSEGCRMAQKIMEGLE